MIAALILAYLLLYLASFYPLAGAYALLDDNTGPLEASLLTGLTLLHVYFWYVWSAAVHKLWSVL